MRKTKQLSKKLSDEIIWEEGSDNVFADLGFENSEEMLAKTKLALYINQLIKQKKLTQIEAAKLLGVDQAKISYLHRGRLTGFSIERLVKFINFFSVHDKIFVWLHRLGQTRSHFLSHPLKKGGRGDFPPYRP